MRDLINILVRPSVKASILGLLTIIFGILCNFTVGSEKPIRWVIFIAFLIINIIILFAYAKSEKSFQQKINDEIQKTNEANRIVENLKITNEAFSKAMQGLATTCMFCAKNANIQIHEIIDKKRIDCKTWNFDLASDAVCQSIYSNVIEQLGIPLANDGIVDVEVGYVKLIESDHINLDEDKICLCGHYHPTRNGQKILGKKRDIVYDGYHDSYLFYSKKDQPDILLDSNDILKMFKNTDGKDYSQFLGIPVFCETQNKNSKMVGLLEIVCHGNSVLANSTDQIQTLANTFFAPYAKLFLLLYKMDKALRAQPKE